MGAFGGNWSHPTWVTARWAMLIERHFWRIHIERPFSSRAVAFKASARLLMQSKTNDHTGFVSKSLPYARVEDEQWKNNIKLVMLNVLQLFDTVFNIRGDIQWDYGTSSIWLGYETMCMENHSCWREYRGKREHKQVYRFVLFQFGLVIYFDI